MNSLDNITPPRSVFGTGTYSGAELAVRPVRPGATDAYRMPSLINGRRVAPADLKAQLAEPMPAYEPPEAAPAPEAPRRARPSPLRRATGIRTRATIPAEHRTVEPLAQFPRSRRTPGEYVPRGMPARVLDHLKEHGGHLMFAEIGDRFGIGYGSLDSCLRKIFEKGILQRVRLGHMTAAALPGYVLPEGAIEKAEADRLARFRATRARRLASGDGIERAAAD